MKKIHYGEVHRPMEWSTHIEVKTACKIENKTYSFGWTRNPDHVDCEKCKQKMEVNNESKNG